jgi:hypothetical protein
LYKFEETNSEDENSIIEGPSSSVEVKIEPATEEWGDIKKEEEEIE